MLDSQALANRRLIYLMPRFFPAKSKRIGIYDSLKHETFVFTVDKVSSDGEFEYWYLYVRDSLTNENLDFKTDPWNRVTPSNLG